MNSDTTFTLKGKVSIINETQEINDRFKKREIIIEYNEPTSYNNPQYVKFETIQGETALLDNFSPNDNVVIQFVIQGRDWTNPKGEVIYFTTLRILNIELDRGNSSTTSSKVEDDPFEDDELKTDTDDDSIEDDLPF